MATDIGELLVKLSADMKGLDSGLKQAKGQLDGFQNYASSFASTLKKTLALAGVAVGLYEIAGALKSFATDAAMVGARTETLNIAMEQVGKTYTVSAASLKFYVDELKGAGITTQESMTAVTKALTTGIPLDQLKDLATRARDIAVVAGINTSEALNRMMQGIITGEQETLRRLMIQVGSTDEIYKRFAATLGKTKEQLNSVEKAQAMVNEVLRLTAGFAGISAAADASVGKQLQSMARFAEEAKNALWALFSPVMGAAVQEMTQGWKDLKKWADANQASLERWGKEVAVWLKWIATGTRDVGAFLISIKDLLKVLAELLIFSKLAGLIRGLGVAFAATAAEAGILAGVLSKLRLLVIGGWPTIVITLVLMGVYEAWQTINRLRAEAGFMPVPGQVSRATQEGRARDKDREGKELDIAGVEAAREAERRGISTEKYLELAKEEQKRTIEGRYKKYTAPSVLPAVLPEHETPAERAAREAKAANEIAKANAPKPLDKDKKGGGKGDKETADNLLAPFQAMLKAKRDLTLQDAQNYYDIQKTTNEKVRADYALSLAKGEMDGTAYYQKLQKLQQAETDGALAMIAKKKEAQTVAYQEALALIEADTKLSDPAKDIARQKLAADEKKAQAKLDAEAQQARIDGEKKITDELKRQVDLRKEYSQKTEDLNLETAQLSRAISEQEAKLRRLILDSGRDRQTAIDKGAMTPEVDAAMKANLAAKQFDVQYGAMMSSISGEFSSGVTNLINDIRNGTLDIGATLTNMFNNIMMAVLKPGFDALGNALTNVISGLIKSAGSALGMSFGGGGGGVDFDAMYSGGALAHGGAFSQGVLQAFASGGIVTRPTLFAMANGMGLMGEAGPEGILPLTRIGGDLGVKAMFPQSAGTPVTVIVNNNSSGAQASAEQQPSGDVVVTIDELAGKAYARRGTLYKLINQGGSTTRR